MKNHRLQPYLFGLFLSCFMSSIVSGISTVRAVGFSDGVLLTWLTSWMSSWAVAFPAVLVVAPIVRKIVDFIVRQIS